MSSSFQDPAFSPTDDAGLLAAARSVLGGTLNSQQDPSFAQPVLYVSGTLAGRTIRGELHELRDLHIDAEGTVVPPPVLLGRLFEVKTNDQGEAKEVEIDEEQLDLLGLFHASTVNGGEEVHAKDVLHDLISSPAYIAKVDGHPCYFFHFPGLVFKRSGTFRLSFYFFEANSFPAQPAPPALPASSSSFEQPSGRISIAQAKCFSKSVLTVPPLSSEDESADAGAGASAV